MKKETHLYNIFFPIWMLMIIPTAWIAVLPINFIVDSLVLIIAQKKMNICTDNIYKKHILKVWIFGFISDIIGALYMLGMMLIFEIDTQPDDFRLTIPATLLSAVLIFIFNYFISFKDLDKKERVKMAMSFAVFTAPYTFLIPLAWIYG
jgi:hypothetical protein